jgi:hypothetical protein
MFKRFVDDKLLSATFLPKGIPDDNLHILTSPMSSGNVGRAIKVRATLFHTK